MVTTDKQDVGVEEGKNPIKLTTRSVHALKRAGTSVRLNKADTINRAIETFEFITNAMGEDPNASLLIEFNGRQQAVVIR